MIFWSNYWARKVVDSREYARFLKASRAAPREPVTATELQDAPYKQANRQHALEVIEAISQGRMPEPLVPSSASRMAPGSRAAHYKQASLHHALEVVETVSPGSMSELLVPWGFGTRPSQAIRGTEIASYLQMKPREFEEALARLCERDGCTGVEVVGGAGDLGADVKGIMPDGRKLIIQAKRFSRTTLVSGPHLQRFGGTCYAVHNADVAVVITTSAFTKQARKYAAHMGIKTYGYPELAVWVSRNGPAPWQ